MSLLPRRHRATDVRLLELWNLPLDGRELWELLGVPRVEALRAAGQPNVMIAQQLAEVASRAITALQSRHAFSSIFATGGLTELTGFRTTLNRLVNVPISFATSGIFGGEPGGRALLARNGTVVDVGQTSVKVLSGIRRVVVGRPPSLPRLFIGHPRPADGRHIEKAIDFIARSISLHADRGHIDEFVLALPCPLDDALRPGGCTYGWESEPKLVAKLLQHIAGYLPSDAERTVHVMNDAELAAESARTVVLPRPTLVLTLGFGPGGALLTSPA